MVSRAEACKKGRAELSRIIKAGKEARKRQLEEEEVVFDENDLNEIEEEKKEIRKLEDKEIVKEVENNYKKMYEDLKKDMDELKVIAKSKPVEVIKEVVKEVKVEAKKKPSLEELRKEALIAKMRAGFR